MKHHRHKPGFKFVVEPVEFGKYTERELLQYCLGATLYMPGYWIPWIAFLTKMAGVNQHGNVFRRCYC